MRTCWRSAAFPTPTMTSESGHAVLVLGAGGQIGSALVPRLLAAGNEVVALRRTGGRGIRGT